MTTHDREIWCHITVDILIQVVFNTSSAAVETDLKAICIVRQPPLLDQYPQPLGGHYAEISLCKEPRIGFHTRNDTDYRNSEISDTL